MPIVGFAALAIVLVAADCAWACPSCKDTIGHEGQNLARGFYYSILFMLSMPFLIFGSLCTYFYWEVCRARKRQAQAEQLAHSTSLEPTAGMQAS